MELVDKKIMALENTVLQGTNNHDDIEGGASGKDGGKNSSKKNSSNSNSSGGNTQYANGCSSVSLSRLPSFLKLVDRTVHLHR